MAAFLVAGCGSSVSEPAPTTTTTSAQTSATNSTSTSPAPLPTTSTNNLLPPVQESFTVTGSGGTNPTYSVTVDTDNLLQVQITAGAATNVIPGSNFSANYGCVTYNVTALGQTVTTNTLGVNGGNSICPNAPSSQTIDFSSRLTPGHGAVAITVSASGYDFYCQGCLMDPALYDAYPYGPYSCSMYCPLHTVFKNHGVTGTISVQVNGTSLN